MDSEDEDANYLTQDEILDRLLAKEDPNALIKRLQAERAHRESTSRSFACIERMKRQRNQPGPSGQPTSPPETTSICTAMLAAETICPTLSISGDTRQAGAATQASLFTGDASKIFSPNQENTKRSRTEEIPTVEDNRLNVFWDKISSITEIIRSSKNKINKEDKNTIQVSLDLIGHELVKLALDLAVAKTRAATLNEFMEAQRGFSEKLDSLVKRAPTTVGAHVPMGQRRSYASAASGPPPSGILVMDGLERALPPLQPTVLFYPTVPEGKTSDETQKELMKVLDPSKDGFQAVRTRKLKGGGLMVQTSNTAGLDNIKKASAKIAASGLKMVHPQGNLPKIVLYDVPKGEPAADRELFTEIYTNNITGKSTLSLEDHLRTMRRVSLFGKRDSSSMNMIVTCHPESRKVLIDSGLCFLGWNACRVRDYLGATRCFKCHLYGHVSKFCTMTSNTCRHCAATGHDIEDCPKKADAAVCATCKRFNKPSNHPTGDRSCPAHHAAIEAQVRKTDYGRR